MDSRARNRGLVSSIEKRELMAGRKFFPSEAKMALKPLFFRSRSSERAAGRGIIFTVCFYGPLCFTYSSPNTYDLFSGVHSLAEAPNCAAKIKVCILLA